jgi:ankyrin repeat protein
LLLTTSYFFGLDDKCLLVKLTLGRPSLGDRNKLLIKEDHVLRRSDESAWTIVQSRPSTIVNSVRSSGTTASVELAYRRLSFEDELFTAPVYKRNNIGLMIRGRFPTDVQRSKIKNETLRAPRSALDHDDDGHADTGTEIVTPSIPPYAGSSYDTSSILHSYEETEVVNDSVKLPAPSILERTDDIVDPVDITSGLSLLSWAEGLGYTLPVNGQVDTWLLDVATSQDRLDILGGLLRSSHCTDTYEWVTEAFFGACEHGNERMVKVLSESALDVNCLQAVTNWTGLHVAALHNRVQIGELLLSLGAKIDAKSVRGDEPIHISSHFGNTAFVSFLLSSGAPVSSRNAGGQCPIQLAVSRSCVESVRLLWESGAWKDPYCLSSPNMALFLQAAIASSDRHGSGRKQPIHLAAEQGLVLTVATLVEAGASVYSIDEKGLQPIHLATMSRKCRCIAWLVWKGADVDARTHDENKYTPLQLACSRGLGSSVHVLLNLGASCSETQWSHSPLGLALLGRHINVVKILFRMKPEIRASDPEVGGPALSALMQGKHEREVVKAPCEEDKAALRALLKYGLDVNVQNSDGDRALHNFYWYQNHNSLPELLLKNGYDPNAIDRQGNQALHDIAGEIAEYWNHYISYCPMPYSQVELLLDHGANIDAVNREGKTALHIAAENGKLWLVECLIQRGAKRLSAADIDAIDRIMPLWGSSYQFAIAESKIVEVLRAQRLST